MRDRPKGVDPPQVLSGWKDIANYLGKGVRTVQRYEQQFGLPVRRPAGKPSGSVVATKAELDAWVTASPIREEFRLVARHMDGDYQVCLATIRKGLDKMLRLRKEMLALRQEVRDSINSLRQSVSHLHVGLNQSRWMESSGPTGTVPRPVFEEEYIEGEFDLIPAVAHHGRAS